MGNDDNGSAAAAAIGGPAGISGAEAAEAFAVGTLSPAACWNDACR